MALLGVGKGDEVVVPANTFVSTANAVLYAGGTPIFADCDLESFNVTAHTIKRCISRRTKAVIVVHIAGNPCEMDEIQELCEKKDLVLIEDCAHALISKYKGRNCGLFGLAGAFSLYPTKVLTAGEGGLITTGSKEIDEKARIFRNVGRRGLGPAPVTMLGYNYRMTDVHACIALNQLKHLKTLSHTRKRIARAYDEALGPLAWIEHQKIEPHAVSAYYAYICRLLPTSRISRNKLILHLRRRRVETTIMFRPVYQQPYYSAFAKARCFNAEAIGNDTIALPMHGSMTEEDVRRVVNLMKSAS